MKQLLVLVYAVRRSEIVPWILWITSDPKLLTDLVLHKKDLHVYELLVKAHNRLETFS